MGARLQSGTVVPFAPAAAPATAAPPTAPATASVHPRTLADVLAERLAGLTRKVAAHHAELETRVCCAEAELAALDEKLENLRVMSSGRPALFVISSTEMDSPPPDAASPQVDEPVAPMLAVEVADTSAAALPDLEPASTTTVSEDDDEPAVVLAPPFDAPEAAEAVEPPVTASPEPLPPPASEAELARALEMLNTFTDQLGILHASESERLRLLERNISVMRGRVEHERGQVAAAK